MADIRTQILRKIEAGGYIDSDFIIDAAGNLFLAIATGEFPPTNQTWIEVYKVAPGGPVPGSAQWRVLPTNFGTPNPQKIDAVQVYYSGTDLRVVIATHEPGAAPRDCTMEQAVIPGVFVYEAGMELQSGGPNAFAGEGQPDPDPGGTEVDYERVEAIVEFVMQRELGGLAALFGGGSVRGGIEEKAKDAAVELLTGTDPRATQYKDALFDFLKNAAAGPLANVLGGQDAWGVARRDELKAIIQEVIDEQEPE